MKRVENKVLEIVSKVALKSAKKEENSACMFLGYQLEVPQNIDILK